MKSDTIRMIVGFVLVVAILIVWQLLVPARRRPAPAQPVPAAQETTAGSPALTIVESAPLPPTAPPVAMAETTVVLENELLRVELTSAGGAISRATLKKYNCQLVPESTALLGTVLEYAGRSWNLSQVPGSVVLGERTATFAWALPEAGASVVKSWTLRDDYQLDLTLEVPEKSAALVLDAGAGIRSTERNDKEDLANFHFYARDEKKVHQLSAATLRRRPFAARADWAGLKSKYFFLAVVRPGGMFDSTRARALDDGRIGFEARAAAPAGVSNLLVYLGPVEYKRLKSFGLGFENVVSLGWLKPIALAILWIIELFYRLVRNWGWAIVLFSVLMKAVFFPLTRIQTRQMRQMQLLQPKFEELKKKYKNDPKMLNDETMRLYRVYKINPLSGCLPLLVQMPVFFALYAVLRTFIELRGASFVLWLKDLSVPDTLFGHIPRGVPMIGGYAIGLLPILMGVSFIAQNFLTSTDRKNWAMTLLFPIFITAIFLNLSSGLQLYWFVYNVLSILESVVATRGGKLWRMLKPRSARIPDGPSPTA
ncbi:MAG: membrane protein insertase YidC [candidate division WOR-3 bacterium]